LTLEKAGLRLGKVHEKKVMVEKTDIPEGDPHEKDHVVSTSTWCKSLKLLCLVAAGRKGIMKGRLKKDM